MPNNQYHDHGAALIAQHRYDEAIVALDKAIRQAFTQNEKAEIYYKRGNAYQAKALHMGANNLPEAVNFHIEALTSYSSALTLFTAPDDQAKVHFNAGISYQQIDQHPHAIHAYRY